MIQQPKICRKAASISPGGYGEPFETRGPLVGMCCPHAMTLLLL